MFGSHLSIAGGMHNALIEAQRLGLDCLQVFTKNQRQWSAPPLTDEQIDAWNRHRCDTGIGPVVSHDAYLINLASPRPDTRTKSLDLFVDEIERCDALDIPLLVAHPGAHVGEGEQRGIELIVEAIDEAHRRTKKSRTITCLENTAGQGSNLGYRLEHLRQIIDAVKQPQRLAVCIDTAHALAAGYDLTCTRGANAFLAELDDVIGMPLVRCWHFNDSKTERGSRVDRHEHIGHGFVALDAFAAILKHPATRDVPKVLETPKQDAPDGRPWDTVNIETLRSLIKPAKRPKKPRKKAG